MQISIQDPVSMEFKLFRGKTCLEITRTERLGEKINVLHDGAPVDFRAEFENMVVEALQATRVVQYLLEYEYAVIVHYLVETVEGKFNRLPSVFEWKN